MIARITRASVLDVQNEDYVRTARGQGPASRTVDRRHVLRNAMLPVMTVIGLQVGLLLSGAVLTETVFAFPGVGRGSRRRSSTATTRCSRAGSSSSRSSSSLVNLIVDISYGLLNPRIRLAGK